MNEKEKFMKEAIRLAKKGTGFVSPNPKVGAVLVKNGRIVGKGWHKLFGKSEKGTIKGKHAEINAIANAGRKAYGSDLYVTLEPCNHYGKQPPCTKSIIKSGIRRVIIGQYDPNKVSKNGAKELRKHGIKVEIGMCKKEVKKINEFYITSLSKKRPFITIKSAMNQSGFISYGNFKKKQIGGKKNFGCTQELRKEHDAILVGVNTVLLDDPKLSYRKNPKLNPDAIVLDSFAQTPITSKIFSVKNRKVIILCTNDKGKNARELKKKGAILIKVKTKKRAHAKTKNKAERKNENTNVHIDLKSAMKELGKAGVQSVLVEAGNETCTSFLEEKLFDRFIIIASDKKIKSGLPAFSLKKKIKLKIKDKRTIGKDLLLTLEK